MSYGRRCELGCETWPDQEIYSTCLICGEKTRRVRGNSVTPLAEDEAMKIKLYHEFEKFYVRRCARRGVPVEGPLPDAVQAV